MNIPFLSLHDVTAKYRDEIHEAVLRVVDRGGTCKARRTSSLSSIMPSILALSVASVVQMVWQ